MFFYVYAYLDPRKRGLYKYGDLVLDFEPFYIGKGKNNRLIVHMSSKMRKYNYNPFFNNKINSILSSEMYPIIVKIYENLSEEESFKLEIELIKNIGRKIHGGPLTNIYEGGQGASKPYEVRKKISETKKKWFANGGIHPMQGKKHSEHSIKLFSESRRGKKYTEEQRKNLSRVRCLKKPKNCLYWKLTNPNGEIFIAYGLGEFARKNNLCQGHLFEVSKGKRKHHKGWKCQKLSNEEAQEIVCKNELRQHPQ